MSLVTCRSCERSISSDAQYCVHCGTPLWAPTVEAPAPPPWAAAPQWAGQAPAAEPYPYPHTVQVASDVGQFHAMAVWKLVVMSLCTLGLYELFWFYRNWNRVRERTGGGLSPFWRAFFAPFWAYSLFQEVRADARAQETRTGWSSGALAVAFVMCTIVSRLPDPVALLAFLSVLPLIPVQNTINALAARRGARPDDTFRGRHAAVAVIGGILFVLVVIGSFIPVE